MRTVILLHLIALSSCARAQDTTSIKLIFLGDIMQHESQMKAAYDQTTGTYDYSGLFDQVRPLFDSADLVIGNLEFTFGGKPYTGYPQFSAPDELGQAIKDAGVDVLVTANNHSMDKGRKGLERTIRVLDSLGIVHTGTFVDTLTYLNEYPLLLKRNGFTLSLLNYTYGTNGIAVRKPNIVNLIDTALIRIDLEKAKRQNPDAIIVFFHWGDEYVAQPGTKQHALAKYCLANGARLVIGSHPHVIQPMVWDSVSDNATIYSLGNFVSAQRVRYRNGGALAHVTFARIDSGRTFIKDVAYSLVWVSRESDARRSFRVLPIAEPVDTTIVSGPASRKLMMEFVNDSRSFLDKENRFVYDKARRKKME